MNRLSRATALKIAAVLSLIGGIWGIVWLWPFLAQRAVVDGPSFLGAVIGLTFAIVNIMSAYGVWHNRRWAIILTLVTHALDMIAAAPGLIFAFGNPAAIIAVAQAMLIIILCLWRDRKPTAAYMPQALERKE